MWSHTRPASQRVVFRPSDTRLPKENPMITDALTVHAPVLAAGWSLLYMLAGGGIGGAILIFIGLKAIGR